MPWNHRYASPASVPPWTSSTDVRRMQCMPCLFNASAAPRRHKRGLEFSAVA